MKRHLIVISRLTVLAAAMTAYFVLFTPAVPHILAAGSCTLPDGSTGTVQSDNKTCCPGSATNATDINNGNAATACLVGKYITPAVVLLSALTGILVVISIVYGGFEVITAGDDVSKAANGRKRIVQALIALFAFASLFALFQFLVPGGIV